MYIPITAFKQFPSIYSLLKISIEMQNVSFEHHYLIIISNGISVK